MKKYDDTPRKHKPLIKLESTIDKKLILKTREDIAGGVQKKLWKQ